MSNLSKCIVKEAERPLMPAKPALEKVRHTITPVHIDSLGNHLKSSTLQTTVYFQIMQADSPYADYAAEILRNDDMYLYSLGGHGIGTDTKLPAPLNTTLERVLEDNQRFNNGGAFTYGY